MPRLRLSCALAAVVTASACGGSWSNKDLEFLGALPSRAELKSKLPGVATTSSPLLGRTQAELGVGEPSKAYADAQKASRDFNGLLDSLLTVVDTIRQLPPTQRSASSRRWGPYPDSKNPGAEFVLDMTQTDAKTYAYVVRVRKAPADWVDILEGAFVASEQLTRGAGQLRLLPAAAKAVISVGAPLDQLEKVEVGYFTADFPKRVDMALTFVPGASSGLSALGYVYREQASGAGAIAYQVRSTSADVTVADAVALWNPDGAGRAALQVKEGRYTGAATAECWDAGFKVVFFKEGWTGGASGGEQSACATVEGL